MGAEIKKAKVTPDGDAGLDKTDEERHRRTGAEGGYDPQERCQDIAQNFPLARQDAPSLFRSEERAHDADAKDHQDEQHEDLGDIQEEKGDRVTQVSVAGNAEDGIG